jgi:hypothetical protein
MPDPAVQQEEYPPLRFVYLVWHGDALHEMGLKAKLLGVYSSRESALDRIQRSVTLPGFAGHPDDFWIVRCTIDKDEWTRA